MVKGKRTELPVGIKSDEVAGDARLADDSIALWGELKAYVHVAGYTFEQACTRLETLLNGDGWRLGGRFSDVNVFMDSIRLDNLKASAESRKRITVRIKELQPDVSNRQIARTLGVGSSSINRDAAPNGAPAQKKSSKTNGENFAAAPNGAPGFSGAEVAKLAQKTEQKEIAAEQTKAKREESRNAAPLADGIELRVGDCREVLADVPDNSVPLILTDPPYGDEAELLYEWLAGFAQRVLIPGGSLICYTGQSRLDRDMAILSAQLRYWWMLIMPHDQSQRLPGKFVIAGFKPVLWYVKDHRRGRTLMPDVLNSPARDKTLHNWAQGEGGVSQLIEHLTEPSELIVDPFAGTATWGTVASNMGRRWLGADIARGGSEKIHVA